MPADPIKTEELAAIIREIRERVRARYPEGGTDGGRRIAIPELLPLVHARDAAEAKVASIGTVNPRPPGLVSSVVQTVKKTIARALDWHVREQVEFNRHVMSCVEAILEALNENNRALAALAEIDRTLSEVRREAAELKDVRSHWSEWRQEWEHKLFVNETQFLRSLADLQTAFQHRASLMESNFRDIAKSQHMDFLGALDRATEELQKRFWAEVYKTQREYERLIHEELRVVRQRAVAMEHAPLQSAQPDVTEPQFDYGRFAERFRGTEEYVKKNIQVYLPEFQGRNRVLDLGCGRGEFLEMMKEAGVGGYGVELSVECVGLCRSKGLEVLREDLFEHLASLPDGQLDGIFCAQVVEHLPPARLPELVKLAALKLRRGGLVAIETPNPECLAIFASHFYLDPTHTRPVPHPFLAFLMEESGFGDIRVMKLTPAVESMPALASLPQDFRDAFFGGLDYAILGAKL